MYTGYLSVSSCKGTVVSTVLREMTTQGRYGCAMNSNRVTIVFTKPSCKQQQPHYTQTHYNMQLLSPVCKQQQTNRKQQQQPNNSCRWVYWSRSPVHNNNKTNNTHVVHSPWSHATHSCSEGAVQLGRVGEVCSAPQLTQRHEWLREKKVIHGRDKVHADVD